MTFESLNLIKEIRFLLHGVVTNVCTSLVPYGSNLSSAVGSPKFTLLERNLIRIPLEKLSVFVGIILSDANLQKFFDNGDARLQFKQTINRLPYVYNVYFLLSHYCSSGPYVVSSVLGGKLFYGLSFTTRSLPCITELYNLFYVNGIKVIPHNIYDLITWEALAH